MRYKGKVLVFFASALIVLYGVSAAFYGKVVAKDDAFKELSVFIEALNKINTDYVERPDLAKVQEGAMRGLIEALDPYSSFQTKEQVDALEKRQNSGMAGIGVILSKRAELIYVVASNPEGPASLAGIRPGDYVINVDGTNVEDKSIVEAESLLRGAEGSKVKVAVFRSARTKPVEFDIVRKADAAIPVNSRMLDGNIGLLEISSLSRTSIDTVRVRLKTLISAGAEKLVLDLRENADGNVAQGAEMANLFLKSGIIYYSQNRSGVKVDEVKADAQKFVTELPLVVLTNNSTASGAEVAAGALKDNKRAIVVGDRTFGIGSVQTRIALKNGSVIFLSTAKIFTASGKMIQEENLRTTGIKPDVQAPDDDRHQELMVETYYDEKEEAAKYKKLRERINKEQLDKAVEVLTKGLIAGKRAA